MHEIQQWCYDNGRSFWEYVEKCEGSDIWNFLGTLISILIEILLILVLVFVIWGAGRWAYSFGYAIFAEKTVEEEPGTDIQVTITEGQSNRQISKMLEEKGLIRDADPFYVRLMLTDYKKLNPHRD